MEQQNIVKLKYFFEETVLGSFTSINKMVQIC
jgi:hypothetical protein